MANYYTVYVKPSCLWTDETLIDKRIDAHFYSIKYMQYYNKLMKCKIKKISLYNICSRMNSGPFGSALLASQYVDKGVAFIRPLNCKDYIVDIDNDVVFISKEDSERLKSSKFSLGDLIFTKIGNGIGDVAIIPQKIFECNISGNLMGVKIKNNIDNYYVLTFLKSIYGQNQIWQGMMNSAKPKIDMDTLKSIVIPIPSPEIQKYIGDKVRKAEELREEAKRLKKEAETFLYEMIQLKPLNDFDKDMFSFVNSNYIDSERLDSEYYKTKYITLEKLLKSKKVTSFKDIIIESKYGASVPADYTMVGIPFIRGNNLTDNEINIDDIVYLNKKLKDEVKDHHVNTGDILITRSGTVGISAVVDEKCDGFSFGSFMIKLRIDMRIWNPYYIAAFLNSFWGKWQIERLQNGAVQQNINLQEIGRIIIPIISKENQDKIEELIKNYINKKRQSKQLIQEAKQDVEDLIEGNFDMSKVRANS
jgi:type I restriction enzyme S subunit